jgi:hypothetical protein
MLNASSILDEAATSQFGIAVTTESRLAAQNLRRKLYEERARLRRSGAKQFDSLSVLIKGTAGSPQQEVWIIPRPSRTKPSEPYRSRALAQEELPELVRARGPRKPSALLRNLLHPAVSAGPKKAW